MKYHPVKALDASITGNHMAPLVLTLTQHAELRVPCIFVGQNLLKGLLHG